MRLCLLTDEASQFQVAYKHWSPAQDYYCYLSRKWVIVVMLWLSPLGQGLSYDALTSRLSSLLTPRIMRVSSHHSHYSSFPQFSSTPTFPSNGLRRSNRKKVPLIQAIRFPGFHDVFPACFILSCLVEHFIMTRNNFKPIMKRFHSRDDQDLVCLAVNCHAPGVMRRYIFVVGEGGYQLLLDCRPISLAP